MQDTFVPLATILRGARVPEARVVAATPAAIPQPLPRLQDPVLARETCAQLALARLAACEAFERAAARLIELLARDVLVRELALAPADVAALVARVRALLERDEAVTVVVAPCDAERITSGVPLRADPALEPGDVVVEVRDATIDARFALRAADAVAAALA
jgi:flagellar biosynthesis/type III secretory pathway protein FliH